MSLSDVHESGFDESCETNNADTCPECPGDLRREGGEVACTECGLIVTEYWIDHGPEHFTETVDGRERTGPPSTPTRHDRGISTEIGWNKDANGNALSTRTRRKFGRLRIRHSRSRWASTADRNLARGLSEVRRLVGALDLPTSIRDQACRLFRSAQSADLLPGRSVEGFAAASIYAACRCAGLPWSLGELAEHSPLTVDKIENAYAVMNRELGLPARAQSPVDYVPRFATTLGVSDDVRLAAERLARRAITEGLANGRNPAGIAAACLYEVAKRSGRALSQQVVADCADVSPMTVRTRWREVRKLSS